MHSKIKVKQIQDKYSVQEKNNRIMTNTLEKSSFPSSRHDEDFNLKDWSLKARISRENTNSRRFSASNLKSFREEARSFRSNMTISSAASSPGYTIREEINPATYSFTTALRALQAKTVYSWEHLSPDGGLTLHSKWNDAEKYICNPLSGEVPLECLSAKTLSARSFRSLTSRITMSAPLIYPTPLQQFHAKSPIKEHENEPKTTMQEKKNGTTRDVGTQSTPEDLSSGSVSPAATPSIEERSMKHRVAESADSPVFSEILQSNQEVEMIETREEDDTETNGEDKMRKNQQMMRRCQGGCLSLKYLWMRRNPKEKQKQRSVNRSTSSTFYQINGC